jgi:hypothetical protein
LTWRLSELRLSGTTLNTATIDALATYLAHPQSSSLHELYLDNSYLAGRDIATLLYSMIQGEGKHRNLHFDISQSHITKDLEYVTQAISNSMAPSHLSMRAIEYREESTFRKILSALTVNKSIQYLDISQTALPGAASEDTCRAFKKLFAENDTIAELNLSGEESRLATSRFGSGINDALTGLKHNKALRILHIEHQKLGIQGASTLAGVLKENNTLTELYCNNNEIPLTGLTDLVNSIVDNTNIIHLPTMDDGRAAALRSAENTMKAISMKRGFASVRRSAQRASSVYSPSVPRPQRPESTAMPPPPRSRQAAHTGPVAAIPSAFTVQDIQTTQQMLTDQWDRQCYRLAQYLDRNWCLLNAIPTNMNIPDFDANFDRPDSSGSLGKILAQVKYDTTPRAERTAYIEEPVTFLVGASRSPSPSSRQASITDSPLLDSSGSVEKQIPAIPRVAQSSFKQFILDTSPDLDDELAGELKQVRTYDEPESMDDEPNTPRQATMGARSHVPTR